MRTMPLVIYIYHDIYHVLRICQEQQKDDYHQFPQSKEWLALPAGGSCRVPRIRLLY